VIRYLFVVQVPDASDKRGMAPSPRPLDRLVLRFEFREHVIRMVLHDVIFDMASLGLVFGPRLDVNVLPYAIPVSCVSSWLTLPRFPGASGSLAIFATKPLPADRC